MGTGGAEQAPHLLPLHLLLQLTEALTGQPSAPQHWPGDPPGGVLVMHQVCFVALTRTVCSCCTISAVQTPSVMGSSALLRSMSAIEACY